MRNLLAHLRNLGIAVQFCLVPAHIGIKGNEVADKIAKKTLNQDHIIIHIPLGKGEVKTIIKVETMKRWQEEREG